MPSNRKSPASRALVREARLSADSLVMPLFVRSGARAPAPIRSMPGQFQWPIDGLVSECEALFRGGVPAVLLFGVTEKKIKNASASAAYAEDGLVPRAVRAIKKAVPDLAVITDVCLCAYTADGHCRLPSTEATLKTLGKMAVAHAAAGADFVGPSDMTDGNVGAVREALAGARLEETGILAYTVKYASALYGPFREAADSTPASGDRRSYQMDPSNAAEALREAEQDIAQGADILMVKPALGYLDIVHALKQRFALPVAAYNVSGEYAMVKAAAQQGWLDERSVWMEQLLCMRRAGADILITYWAKDAARMLRGR